MACPVLASYQRRLRSSVTSPSWTMRLPDRSSGSTSPRFSRHSRIRAASSSPMMIRASEPPMKWRRSEFLDFRLIPASRNTLNGALENAAHIGHEVGKERVDLPNINSARDVLSQIVQDRGHID